jgi:hypothetical protein
MASRVHRFVTVAAFNANDISGQRFELNGQLRAQRIDVALLMETHLKPHERFCLRNYHIYRTHQHPRFEGRTAVAVRKGVPHTHEDVPPFFRKKPQRSAHRFGTKSRSRLLVTDLAGQPSLFLGFEPPLGLMTRCLRLLTFAVLYFCFGTSSLPRRRFPPLCLLYIFYLYILFFAFIYFY